MATKRNVKDYIDWEDYFMGIAFLSAERSKDPSTQVGACIVNQDQRIVGVGYNGFPNNCSDDEFPWGKNDEESKNKHTFVCHAELNAIVNKNSSSVKDCSIYVTQFPCHQCAKLIVQCGIKEIIYVNYEKDWSTDASKKMFDAAKVKYRHYTPVKHQLTIVKKEVNNQ